MENETVKLLNVLRRIARAAGYAAWARSDEQAVRFCISQYNKVLAKLVELEPGVKPLFTSLPEETSPEVIRMAARELLAYFESDYPDVFSWGRGRAFAFGCGPRRSRRGSFPMAVGCDS